MAVSILTLFGATYTIHATVNVVGGVSGEVATINVPANLENYWLRRLGFVIGVGESKIPYELQASGLLDTLTIVRISLFGWSLRLIESVLYTPANPAGQRLQFFSEIYDVGSTKSANGTYVVSIKLPHSIHH